MTPINPAHLSAPRTDGVNALLTMIGVAQGSLLCHAASMTNPTPMAGGFFLILPIVVGFIWGLISGHALQGAILGLGAGLMLALIVWLVDRARQRR